ncbi:MAG: N-acetylmuramoyl-L-alanine amidase, partial [Rhodobacteraceae bacterium]|nr:N-acetylmuramoyl-L-alanine amidase [Paracoccaceae bacterium]
MKMKSICTIIWLVFVATTVVAQETAVSDIIAENTTLSSDGYEVTLTLALSNQVPYRVFTLDSPRRLLIDFPQVDFSAMPVDLAAAVPEVENLRWGVYELGKMRLVVDLSGPYVIKFAEMTQNNTALLSITLARSDAVTFRHNAEAHLGNLLDFNRLEPVVAGAVGLPLIAIDAGHGGDDAGAIRDNVIEKKLTLVAAFSLRHALLETGRYRVLMTRQADIFVPLVERTRLARASHADIFLSLHANTVTRGNASGTSVFTQSTEASDDEAATRAAFENRSDIIAGAALQGEDDQIATVLLAMAQRET